MSAADVFQSEKNNNFSVPLTDESLNMMLGLDNCNPAYKAMQTPSQDQLRDIISQLKPTDTLDAIRERLDDAITDKNGAEKSTEKNEVVDSLLPAADTDFASLSVEDLSRAVGSLRAQKAARTRAALQHDSSERLVVTEKARRAPVKLETRKTVSRDSQWCKMAPDGFTPIRSRPSVKAITEYDSVTTTPEKRTWWRIDPFVREDVVKEIHEVKFPCVAPIRLARDITLAWQMYAASDLSSVDRQLLANTPLTVKVDGIAATRYVDMWGQLRKIRGGELSTSLSWRVLNGEITSR